jgi:hypothetical protein
MNRLLACSLTVLLVACASKSPAPTPASTEAASTEAEAVPVVEVQAVPAATAAQGAVATKQPAVVARARPIEPVPALLEATDRRIASMDQTVPGVESGQLWKVVDAQKVGEPDAIAEAVGAASFGREAMEDEGTWAVGCTRLREDLIGTVAVPEGGEQVVPSWEVVPGTLKVADSESQARSMRTRLLECN